MKTNTQVARIEAEDESGNRLYGYVMNDGTVAVPTDDGDETYRNLQELLECSTYSKLVAYAPMAQK